VVARFGQEYLRGLQQRPAGGFIHEIQFPNAIALLQKTLQDLIRINGHPVSAAIGGPVEGSLHRVGRAGITNPGPAVVGIDKTL